MKFTTVQNICWANSEQTVLNCEVLFDEYPGQFLPFAAVASGDYPHTHEIFKQCIAGNFGEIKPYVAPIELTTGGSNPQQPTSRGTQTL